MKKERKEHGYGASFWKELIDSFRIPTPSPEKSDNEWPTYPGSTKINADIPIQCPATSE